MYVGTHVSFISASMAHNTNKQTNEQADRWTNEQKQTKANNNAKSWNTQLSYYNCFSGEMKI